MDRRPRTAGTAAGSRGTRYQGAGRTVARTYRELEAEGLITARRGGGSRVAETLPAMIDGQRQQQLGEYAFDYVLKARPLGARDGTIHDAVNQAISKSVI